MKNISLFSLIFLFCASVFAQFSVTVNGTIANTSGSSKQVFITISDSTNTDTMTVFCNATTGSYSHTFSGWPTPWAGVSAEIINCKSLTKTGYGYWAGSGSTTINLDYCPPPTTTCHAMFIKKQSVDSVTSNPIPNMLDVLNTSSNFGSPVTYLWDFGDGSTSATATPTHTYSGSGPYVLCLTISDGSCTDTHCDTLTVDSAGMIMKGSSAGFTIHVGGYSGTAPTGIRSVSSESSVTIFPNPARNMLNINLSNFSNKLTQIELVGLQGQVMHLSTINTKENTVVQINVSDYTSGMYLLKLTTDNRVVTKRVMID